MNDILVSGYLREYERTIDFIIPNLVHSVISSFAEQLMLYGLGTNTIPKSIGSSNDIFANGNNVITNCGMYVIYRQDVM